MISGKTKKAALTYVELPEGIFTSDGYWYHTTEKDLNAFSEKVIRKTGLTTLLQHAGDWSQIPVSLSIWSLPMLLPSVGLWPGVVGTLAIYLVLSAVSPTVVFLSLTKLVRWLNHPIAQGLFYVMMLSFFAQTERMDFLLAGLIGFVVFRWQIVDKVMQPVVSVMRKPLSTLPVHDQILRNMIIRNALKIGAPLKELDRMEQRVLDIYHYRRRKK